MEAHLRENLDWLTEKVLDEEDNSMREEVPKMTKRELYIKWRGYNKKLLETPQNLILGLSSGKPIEQPFEFDPYPKEETPKT